MKIKFKIHESLIDYIKKVGETGPNEFYLSLFSGIPKSQLKISFVSYAVIEKNERLFLLDQDLHLIELRGGQVYFLGDLEKEANLFDSKEIFEIKQLENHYELCA